MSLSSPKQRHSTARFFSSLALVLGTSVSVLGGCGLILGLEERTEGEADGGDGDATNPDLVEDSETGIFTTELCIEYCDEVMDNCSGGNAVYASRASCVNTCTALPPGEAAEPVGNSVECRLQRAKGASSTPEEECTSAGPGGDPSCGSNCDAWCHLLEAECPDDFGVLADCMESCSSIRDEGGFDVESSYSSNDIQCRLIHLGAVGGDAESIHCEHARYIASDFCVDAEGDSPDCETYCDVAMANCRGNDAVYESESECLATCAALPLGELTDLNQNTVGCRIYHGRSASQDPGTHCDHASPTGDGHCGSTRSDDGNCLSYCTLLEAGCGDVFDANYADIATCQADCDSSFEDSGAANDVFYTVDTATNEDSLQCRVYYTVKALDGDLTACAKADPTATCD